MTVRDESEKPAASRAHSCAISVAVGREGGEHRSCPQRPDAQVTVIFGFFYISNLSSRSMMTIYYLTITMALSGGLPGKKGCSKTMTI